jgi:hypothetical protein
MATFKDNPMSDNSVPLSVIANPNNQYYWGQVGIGNNVTTQSQKGGYWILVVDRSSLQVVYNQVQGSPSQAPDIGNFNTPDYLLIVATLGVGLNNPPQGDLFQFLDVNGGGRELRRIEQIAFQFNCGSLGTFGYALVGILGNTNQPGFEASQVGLSGVGPILTVQLMPMNIGGKTVYTPVQIDNA